MTSVVVRRLRHVGGNHGRFHVDKVFALSAHDISEQLVAVSLSSRITCAQSFLSPLHNFVAESNLRMDLVNFLDDTVDYF